MYIHNSIYMNQTASNTTQSKKKKKIQNSVKLKIIWQPRANFKLKGWKTNQFHKPKREIIKQNQNPNSNSQFNSLIKPNP